MPPDPRDRVLTDLIARVRQIERRGRQTSVVAAKVIRPAGAVTNVTEVTEENVTNLTNPSASVRNSALTGWTEPGSPGQMPWASNRADAGFSTASNGITVAEGGWYRLETFVAMEAESPVYARVTFSVNGSAFGGAARLEMDEDPYDDGPFFDGVSLMLEVELEVGDVVGVQITPIDGVVIDAPAGASTLAVTKV